MSELISGQISFTGLGSGTDFNTIVDKLIEIEGTHKRTLEAWKKDWELKVEAIQAMNSAMLTLQSSLSSMDSMNEFISKEVASSDDLALKASANASAAEGTHTVQIYQLAQTAIMVNQNGVSSPSTSINDSGTTQNFVYQYAGGAEITLQVADGTSLEGLRNLINSDPDNPGVRASIVEDGSSSYLQLRGLDMGSNASLTISGSTTLSNYSATDFDTTQINQDSKIKVDGWPMGSNAWIQNDSNTVTGAIEGVTLNLKSAPSTPGETADVTISISTDLEGIKENVRTFVTQVNDMRSVFRTLTKYNETEETGSIMSGNYAVQLVDSKMKVATSDRGLGFLHFDESSGYGDVYSALSQIGITTDAQKGSQTEGMLLLDEDMLADALENDINAVAELFAAEYIGGQQITSADGSFNYYSHISGITKAGVYDVSYDIDASGDITNAYINGHAATINNSEGTITAVTPDTNELGMVIKINDFSANTSVKGTVRLKQGKAGEINDLLDNLTSDSEGPLKILDDNYGDIIKNIGDKIEFEEVRLEKRASVLRLKYARLEALLGEYDQLSTSLTNQVNQLQSST